MFLLSFVDPCPHIITRAEWNARDPYSVQSLPVPVEYAFIHHTATATCNSIESCGRLIQSIQNYHMSNTTVDGESKTRKF